MDDVVNHLKITYLDVLDERRRRCPRPLSADQSALPIALQPTAQQTTEQFMRTALEAARKLEEDRVAVCAETSVRVLARRAWWGCRA